MDSGREYPSECASRECADGASSGKRCDGLPIDAWRRYLSLGLRVQDGSGGIRLDEGLTTASKLREPIFTPATKEDTGHDINISFEEMSERIGAPLATELRDLTLTLYSQAAEYALTRGIIIADTKFEFGLRNGKVVWIDEALTPDSSRFWPAEHYKVGSNPPSFDKQFVRDWLETTDWDKNPPAPELPTEVVARTREKYLEAIGS